MVVCLDCDLVWETPCAKTHYYNNWNAGLLPVAQTWEWTPQFPSQLTCEGAGVINAHVHEVTA